MNEHEKKKGGWKRVLLITVLTILALLLIMVACLGVYVNYLLDRITPYDTANDSTISSSEVELLLQTDPDLETMDPDDSEPIPDISEIETFPTEDQETPKETYDYDVTNILLVGQDTWGSTRTRSDSMILVTFNKNAGTITLTSFMRDCYVQIPGYKPHKLNHAFQYGGMKLLNETLRVNFGVRVDGNVVVNFNDFENLIDLLGGVDINLTAQEAVYINSANWDEWFLTEGPARLNGAQALAYSRIREIDSDYRRAQRQRTVISSVMERYKNQSLDQMLGLLDDILPMITTDMGKGEIVSAAMDLFPMLAGAKINTMRIPVDGTFQQGNVKVRDGLKNWFQYDIDFEANKKVLLEIFEAE